MSTLEAIWALEVSPDVTDDERADAISLLKAGEWSSVVLPVTVGPITVTSVAVTGPVVELRGTGDAIDWPLRLMNAPVAVPDPAGPDVDAHGQAWRVDCATILADILDGLL